MGVGEKDKKYSEENVTERDAEKGDGGPKASKGDVVAFVRGAQGNPNRRKSFVEGEWWSDTGEFKKIYVEKGWTDEDGFLNEVGAAIINYADSLYDEEDGFDTVLASLNKMGTENFIRKAVGLQKSGEFEEDVEESGGFTGDSDFLGEGGFF